MYTRLDNRQNFTASIGPKKSLFKAARYALSINEGELYKTAKNTIRKMPSMEIAISGRAHNFPNDCVVMRVSAKNRNLDIKRKSYYVNYETNSEGKAIWEAIKNLVNKDSELHKTIFNA